MKKLIAVTLAALMSLSVSVTAFAANPVERKLTELTSNPISEDGVAYNAGDSVTPNQTIYFLIPNSAAAKLNDSKTTKVSIRKTKNAKLVKSVKLVEKKITTTSGNYIVPVVNTLDPTKKTDNVPMNQRNTYLAVELNDTTGTDEYKVELAVSFTAKKADVNFTYGNASSVPANANFLATPLKNGDKLTLNASFYVANKADSGDTSVTVGNKGMIIKPVKNDINEVIFESDDTLATLTFKANSNPDKFYAKLTTKWTSDLLAKFKNTDAVIRRFTPATIDSSSRAVLMLNNPFDEDAVDTDDVYIYTVDSKGVLTNVTSSFTYDEDEDAFVTKTRTLGTWIISDTKIKLK
ncbi:hypothetical protein V6615_07440 [Oscillospiraceae bacterium PP1C4]